MLISKKKCRHFIDNKIKPRSVAWTQSSRTLHKKENVVKEQKIEIPRVVKIVRGFPSVPASLIIERMEKAKEAKEAKAEKKDAKKDDNRFTKTEKLRKSDTKRK